MPTDNPPETLAVRFGLLAGVNGMVDEDHDALTARAQPIGLDGLEGEIAIPLPGDMPPLRLSDSLGNLVWSLGLGAVQPLRDGTVHEFRCSSQPDGLRLVPAGGNTLLQSLDGTPQGEVPTAALAAGLVACMHRVRMALLRLGHGNDEVQAMTDAMSDRLLELEGE